MGIHPCLLLSLIAVLRCRSRHGQKIFQRNRQGLFPWKSLWELLLLFVKGVPLSLLSYFRHIGILNEKNWAPFWNLRYLIRPTPGRCLEFSSSMGAETQYSQTQRDCTQDKGSMSAWLTGAVWRYRPPWELQTHTVRCCCCCGCSPRRPPFYPLSVLTTKMTSDDIQRLRNCVWKLLWLFNELVSQVAAPHREMLLLSVPIQCLLFTPWQPAWGHYCRTIHLRRCQWQQSILLYSCLINAHDTDSSQCQMISEHILGYQHYI